MRNRPPSCDRLLSDEEGSEEYNGSEVDEFDVI